MTVASSVRRATGDGRRDASPPARLGVGRAPRHMLVGLALMVGFALVFAVVGLRADPAQPVLALQRPVAAGQTISEADLRVVRVVPGAGMEVLGQSERSQVVGRTATVPLAAGSLLTAGQLGPSAWPPVGESVIAVSVPADRTPAGLATGSQVSVLVNPGEGAEAQGGQVAASASVVAVESPNVAGVSSVSLLLPSREARRVAAAGDVVLVLESPSQVGG